MSRRLRSAAASAGASPGKTPKRKRTRSETAEETGNRTKKPKKNEDAVEVKNERVGKVQTRRGKGKKKLSVVAERAPSQSEEQGGARTRSTRRVLANQEDSSPESPTGSTRGAGKSTEPALASSSSNDLDQVQQRHSAEIAQLTLQLEEQTKVRSLLRCTVSNPTNL
jgi:hypothetical protein